MKQPLPWSITGIPREVRDLARTAAAKEGISVGDWLTRRILSQNESGAAAETAAREAKPAAVKTAPDSDSAFQRIDEILRHLSHRLDANEQSLKDAQSAMGAAAAEIHAATQDQTQAFALLTQRIERVERNADGEVLRDAVRSLHQGMSRLADQIARTTNESNNRVAAFAETVDALSEKLAAAREETRLLEQTVTARLETLVERLDRSERLESLIEESLDAFGERLEKTETQIETMRNESAAQDALQALSERLERLERHQGVAVSQEEFQALSQRLADTEQRTAEALQALNDARTTVAIVETVTEDIAAILTEVAGELPYSSLSVPLLEPVASEAHFEPPSFAELLPAAETAAQQEDAAETLPAPPETAPAEKSETAPIPMQDYLAQARRAAQANVQPVPNGMASFGGKSSTSTAIVDAHERPKTRRYSVPLGLAAATVLALAAGIAFSPKFAGRIGLAARAPGGQLTLDAQPTTASFVLPNIFGPSNVGKNTVTSAPPAPPPKPAPPPPSAFDRLLAKARTGDSKAALLTGLRYADGDGVETNDGEAFAWLRKAAEAGEALAQYRLGTFFESGRGTRVDAKQAAAWYLSAAKQGNRKAMHNLAVAYANGAGVGKNYPEAAHWFEAASDLGLMDSQFNLAVLYERGLGVPVSLARAYRWYAIAAAAGDTESKTRADALASQLPPAAKANADKAVSAFKAKPLDEAANTPPSLPQIAP